MMNEIGKPTMAIALELKENLFHFDTTVRATVG